MKTIITTLILLFICAAGSMSTGQAFALEEEPYVDDIPFNTELIAYQSLASNMVSSDIEEYVNDIPFNTKKIYYETLANKLVTASAEESYVDDIPFSTAEIYCMNRPCPLQKNANMMNQINGINNVPPVEYHTANFEIGVLTNEIIRSYYIGSELTPYQLDYSTDNDKTSVYHKESLLAD